MRSRGQALVELALTLPVLVFLALGGAEFVRIAVTRAGLDAATAAAAAAAARASSRTAAETEASTAFDGIATGYGRSRCGRSPTRKRRRTRFRTP